MHAEGVVGQDLHAGDRLQPGDEGAHIGQVDFIIGDAGNQHVADPQFLAVVGEVLRHGEDVRVAVAGEVAVERVVVLLQVEDEQVGDGQQLVKAAHPVGVLRIEGLPGGVDGGVHAVLFQEAEGLGHEVHLQQRFAAGEGHAAVLLPVVFVAHQLLAQLGRRHVDEAVAGVPGVRVVAELAAQRAAVQEHGAADAGAVHQREGLEGMDPANRVAHQHVSLVRFLLCHTFIIPLKPGNVNRGNTTRARLPQSPRKRVDSSLGEGALWYVVLRVRKSPAGMNLSGKSA